MSFENYQSVWLFWIFPILGILFLLSERKRARVLWQIFKQSVKKRLNDYSVWGRRWQFLFFMFTILFCGIALMKPYLGFDTVEVQHRGVDMYVLVDVSPSMLAQDIKPSRIDRARFKILDFIKILKGDRLGLIAFSGEAFVLTPLTADYQTFELFLQELDPNLFPVPGTNIKGAIEKAVQSFESLNDSTSSKAIVLMTDGEDSIGLNSATIDSIRKLGVKVYVIGIGTKEGAPIPNKDGSYKTNRSGEVILSVMNEDVLQKLALSTGGGYIRSSALNSDLKEIYELGIKKSFEDQTLAIEEKKLPFYYFQMFIAIALGFFMLEVLITHKKLYWLKKLKWKKS